MSRYIVIWSHHAAPDLCCRSRSGGRVETERWFRMASPLPVLQDAEPLPRCAPLGIGENFLLKPGVALVCSLLLGRVQKRWKRWRDRKLTSSSLLKIGGVRRTGADPSFGATFNPLVGEPSGKEGAVVSGKLPSSPKAS